MNPDILIQMNTHNPFAKLLGMEFIRCGDGECTVCLEVRDDHHHGGGVVQGGVAFAMADAAMATGLMSTLTPGHFCATIELKISYYAPVAEGTMTCDAHVVRQGKRVAFTDATVRQGDNIVAKARATFAIVDRGTNSGSTNGG